MTWHLAAIVFAAFGTGADYGSTRAALRVPGIKETGPIARKLGPMTATIFSLALILALSTRAIWWWDAVLWIFGAGRLAASLHNADVVTAVIRRMRRDGQIG